jgi:GAF domain-containing protein
MTDRSERTSRVSRASARQHQELQEARNQSAASREILAALGRSAANPGVVLDTVVEYAAHLCRARAAQLFLLDGDVFVLSRVAGETPEEYRKYLEDHPIARNRSSIVGRAAEDRCTQQIPDVREDAEYGRPDLQSRAGFRSLMSTPIILEDEVVGVLTMWRTDVAPFNDREKELLEEFAVEGAIVLRHVELVRALASKVDQLEALREVGEAVGSSLDLDEVLDRIVSNAVRLTGTDGGSIMEYDESSDSFHVRAAYGSSPDLL